MFTVRSIELVKVPRRIVVADDDVLVREGTVSLLREVGHEVIEQVADAEALIDAVERVRPDLVIADIRMPPTHTSEGIDAARKIRREFPETGVLLLSAHVELDTALEFLGEGERIGYLLKSRIMKIEDLIDAARAHRRWRYCDRLRTGAGGSGPAPPYGSAGRSHSQGA